MTEEERIAADRDVDALYAELRRKHGNVNSRANGYVYEGYFRREQRRLFSLLNPAARVLVDVACGSGLMVLPLVGRREHVIGIDFNDDACRAAHANGLPIVRGDAFRLPLGDASVDEIVCCQFFNQQSAAAVRAFVAEVARVLRAGGRAVLVWRNGDALVHRVALGLLATLDRWRGRALFPHVNHSLGDIGTYARAVGLTSVHESVSFPPVSWHSVKTRSLAARVIGASNVCVLAKTAS